MTTFWTKDETIKAVVYPQLPSFCGVAACCGAANALLGTVLTQEDLHERYGIGERTKLRLPPGGGLPGDLASRPRKGRGMSNWDLIRLFNSILLDAGRDPHAAVLCGADFLRETADEAELQRILEWAGLPSSQAVVHIVNHYALFAGLFRPRQESVSYLILADSATRKGPLRSLPLAEVQGLAAGDERYGWLLLSDRPIPRDVFRLWSESMLPREVRRKERFERIDTTG